MAIGTTNISLRDTIYAEMGKANTSTGYSLGQCKYGSNDIDISNFAAANPSTVAMKYWQGYDHMNMQFRFNGNQTQNSDTYKDTDSVKFGLNGAGIAYTNVGGNATGVAYEFDGSSAYGYFASVSSGVAYKVAAAGTGVIAFWVFPQDNSAGQTAILGNDLPFGSVSSYRGIRFDITTANKIRVIRGDGTGTASSDRRTFESSGTLQQDVWNFVAFQTVYNSTSVGTTANYFWTHNGSAWSNGASFLSGTGGNTAYGSTDGMTLSGASNGGRYFQGAIGGIYAFDQQMATADIESLQGNTRGVY